STSIQQWLHHCSASVCAGEYPKALVPALRLRNFSPSKILNIEARMRKPVRLMIAIGLPSAHGEDDEDNLQREDSDDERSQDGDGDIAEQGIMGILQCLHERGPGAVIQTARQSTSRCSCTARPTAPCSRNYARSKPIHKAANTRANASQNAR